MRERGVQSRRARAAESGPNPAGSPPGIGLGIWQAMAITAVIIATAGWTTVGVLVLNKPAAAASASAESDEVIDESFPPEDQPIPESHLFPDLEALLPTEVSGAPLARQSFTGIDVLPDDGWGPPFVAFLTSVGKTPEDFQVALAEDPDGVLDFDFVWAYRLADVDPATLRDAIVEAVRIGYPELKTATATIVEKAVTTGVYFEDVVGSIWYLHDGVIFDIEGEEQTVSTTILAALPPVTTPPAASPAASSPAASATASALPAP